MKKKYVAPLQIIATVWSTSTNASNSFFLIKISILVIWYKKVSSSEAVPQETNHRTLVSDMRK